jgi:hypothetical protein
MDDLPGSLDGMQEVSGIRLPPASDPAHTSWSATVAGEVPIDGGTTDAQGLGDRRHGVLPRAVHLPGHLELVPAQHRWPAAAAAPGPGSGQARGRALADEVAFELGQGGEHMEDELAARGGGGVDRLLEAAEPDPTVGQAGDGVDQVPERPAKAVELPDDQSVAGPQLVQELLEVGRSVRAPLAVSVNTR